MFDTKRAILMLTFVILATVMCAPAAFGQATTNEVSFTGQTAANSCNNDVISLSGTFHSETTFSAQNGAIHTSFNFTENATGIGAPSGAKYVVNDTMHQEVNSKSLAQEQYFSTKMKLISQGSAPNMTLRFTTHLVVDPNGNVTVNTSGLQTSCN